MPDVWFTEPGASGTLGIEHREDGWYVSSPGGAGETKCLVDSKMELDTSQPKQRVDVVVDSFRWGSRGDVNYLSVSPTSDNSEPAVAETNPQNIPSEDPGGRTRSRSQTEDWTLSDFSGTGEYVNVEATVDAVHMVKKGVSGIPDIKGELTDDSVWRAVVFIVEDGVKHPRLDEGKTFRFENVKDHYYKNGAEVQVKISSRTTITEQE